MIRTTLAVMSLCFLISEVLGQDQTSLARRKAATAEEVATVTAGSSTLSQAYDLDAVAPPVRLLAEDEVGSGVTGSLGIELASQYFFRGIRQEVKGVIVQPSIELSFNVFDGKERDAMDSLDFSLGVWNSLHDGPSGSGGAAGQNLWYENDFYAGLSAQLAKQWTLGLTYTAYSSPNASFSTVEELMLRVGYDDSELWGDSFGGLQPSLGIAQELDNQADGGRKLGTYLEFGIEPSFDFLAAQDIELSVPITLGLSLSDYYEDGNGKDDSFGYLQAGVTASLPLSSMPKKLGAWSVNLGAHVLHLGNNNKETNNGEDIEVFVVFGVSVEF